MTITDILSVVAGVIVAVGGPSFIIWKLSAYLGDIWAKKHLETIKQEYLKEIENIKTNYQKDVEKYKMNLEMLKLNTLRYSEKQFDLYNNLWQSLYTMKMDADRLWDVVSDTNIKIFSKQLKNTSQEVEKSFLFIEDAHYRELTEILDEFRNYEIGKIKLADFYKSQNRIVDQYQHYARQELIAHNQTRKSRYDSLLKQIKNSLKSQLRGGG